MAVLKFKRGNSSNLTAVVLAEGEPGYTLDTKKFYIGNADGTKTLINPDQPASAASADKLTIARNFSASGDATAPAVSFNGTANLNLALTLANSGATAGTYSKVTVNAKGLVTAGASLAAGDIPVLTLSKITDAGTAASKNTGVAAGNVPLLNASGKLESSVLPALAISETFVVASEAAMLALTGAEVGDIAVRSDVRKSFILKTAGASTLANWQELLTPTDAVSSVNGMTGAVTVSTITGNSGTSTKLQTARTIAISGGATGTATSFDGTANITIPITALDISKATAGTLPVARGGTGAVTLTGLVKGNGTGAFTAAVAGTDYLAPSSVIDGGTF